MRPVRLVICGFVGLLAGAGTLAALGHGSQDKGRLPPLGERAYLIDQRHPAAPVEIERASAAPAAAPVLKDPVQPGQVVAPQPAKVANRPAKPVASPGIRTAQLRFHKLDVAGHLRTPRVEFARDLLPVDRADEPVSQDFFPKVYAPVHDDGF